MQARFTLVIVAALGCGRVGFDVSSGVSGRSCGAVVATYPGHADWGDYVARKDELLDPDHQLDESCKGTGAACVHGGERRKLILDGETTCAGITASDVLNAFRWRCEIEDGIAVIFSDGLQAPLSTLVTAAGWNENRLDVARSGRALCESEPAVWWTTPVEPLPANAGTGVVELSTPNIVYVLDASRATSGYVVTADSVSIAMAPDATLRYVNSGASCSSVTGTTTAADVHCVISVAGADFAWIQGRIDGADQSPVLRGINLNTTSSTRLHHVDIRATGADGIDVFQARDLELRDVDQQSSTNANGILLERVTTSRLVRVRTANNEGDGIRLAGVFAEQSLNTTVYNVLSDVVSANNKGNGISAVCGAHHNVISSALVVGNDGTGLYSVCNSGTTLSHVTALHNARRGVHIDQVSIQRLSQIVAVANGSEGLRLDFGTDNNVITNVVTTDNGVAGVHLDTVSNRFDGYLIVGNNPTDCVVVGRSLPGLVDITCTTTGQDGSSSYGADLSTATLRTGRTIASAFTGRVTTADAFAPTVLDWWLTGARSRVWGRDITSVTDPLLRNRCIGDCRIGDWSATPGELLHDRSGDGVTPNAPLIAGAPCPAAVSGTLTMVMPARRELRNDGSGDDDGWCETDEMCSDPVAYLVNATELIDDGRGDDDGLCNSYERCRYSPHLGAQQPTGAAPIACTFEDGIVVGVEMIAM